MPIFLLESRFIYFLLCTTKWSTILEKTGFFNVTVVLPLAWLSPTLDLWPLSAHTTLSCHWSPLYPLYPRHCTNGKPLSCLDFPTFTIVFHEGKPYWTLKGSDLSRLTHRHSSAHPGDLRCEAHPGVWPGNCAPRSNRHLIQQESPSEGELGERIGHRLSNVVP